MKSQYPIFILFVIVFQLPSAFAIIHDETSSYEVVSKVVGQVSDYFITSREVQIQSIINSVTSAADVNLQNENLNSILIPELTSKEFQFALNQIILEKVVSLEADSFSFEPIQENEFTDLKKKVELNFNGKSYWQNLQVDNSELIAWLKVKRRAQKYIEFKTESNSLKISEDEIRNYFDQNRFKFGASNFASFKENIRQYLLKQKIETRLKEWFEVLRKKYKVRTFV